MAIFIKRQSMFRFIGSPVIYGSQASTPNALSMRECLYYFAGISGTAELEIPYRERRGYSCKCSISSGMGQCLEHDAWIPVIVHKRNNPV
ncbi:hypothetical protein BDV36DRAFT_242372 [Aspergillus pseudocaelatus]|uniref:Uncharacterized protein n=1 Tax=Aspergillus pseudocaelatus TaxID=1825620 RepID=A0ABQ6X3N7_9EURO|nr:hypothetical protein BDV36DRAFT_242372 [Aspergillus pseudocaelatus]